MVPLRLIAIARFEGDTKRTRPGYTARVSDSASSLGRPVCTGLKKKKGLASHSWAVAPPTGQSL
jgi:hypothetical protein